jgi:hypothetical protein
MFLALVDPEQRRSTNPQRATVSRSGENRLGPGQQSGASHEIHLAAGGRL